MAIKDDSAHVATAHVALGGRAAQGGEDGAYSPAPDAMLERHQAFWDRGSKGYLTPADVFVGFRRLGFGLFLSLLSVPIIVGTFAYWSQPKGQWLPDLRLRINLRNSARLKHGGDTGTYDRKGRFDEKIFDRVFELWDQGGKGGLSLGDIGRMIREQRAIMDPVGLIAESLEWYTSYYLAAKETPRGKMLTKEDACAIVDGSFFSAVAADLEAGRLERRSLFAAGLFPPKVPKAGGKAGGKAGAAGGKAGELRKEL